jgi:hypothetical protein
VRSMTGQRTDSPAQYLRLVPQRMRDSRGTLR